MTRKHRRNSRGVLYVETLITLPVVIYFALITWQLIDLMIACYMVRHAAISAARAAAVIGPDEPRHYGDQARDDLSGGQRLEDVRKATWRALKAHRHFTESGFELKLDGSTSPNAMLKASVSATYTCYVPALNAV